VPNAGHARLDPNITLPVTTKLAHEPRKGILKRAPN
jgi:hypothetical protein